MQNMSCLPQKCIWNIKKKKKYPLISMVRFKAHICRSCGQLRSVPYSRFTEHLALCATGCKTKLDKCSPRKVDHCCPGLGFKLCWMMGMRRIQICFFVEVKNWSCGLWSESVDQSSVDQAVSCQPATGTTMRNVDFCWVYTQHVNRNGKWPAREFKAQVKTFW